MRKIYNANRPSQYSIMGEKMYYVILSKRGEEGVEGQEAKGEGAGRGGGSRGR